MVSLGDQGCLLVVGPHAFLFDVARIEPRRFPLENDEGTELLRFLAGDCVLIKPPATGTADERL
jgi:hypothetical protein